MSGSRIGVRTSCSSTVLSKADMRSSMPSGDWVRELLKARTRSIIDLVLYFEDLLEGNDDSGLTLEEKLHRLSYKMQWGEEKYLEMWGVRVDCEKYFVPFGRGPLGAILAALRGDQGKVTTSSCDTEDDGSGPRSSSCAYHSEWGLGG